MVTGKLRAWAQVSKGGTSTKTSIWIATCSGLGMHAPRGLSKHLASGEIHVARIPRIARELLTTPQIAAAISTGSESKLTSRLLVLVVDDDAKTARVLTQMLREDGFDAEFVVDGALAIGRLTRPPLPDILLTDLQMPHVNGHVVSHFARSLRADMPVFLLTAYTEMARQGTLQPAPTVIPKPLDYSTLSSALNLLRR